jgi:hypothetical protein
MMVNVFDSGCVEMARQLVKRLAGPYSLLWGLLTFWGKVSM